MAVTIKDIAKDTGLAVSTISVVLNKKKTKIPISQDTKDRVWVSAKKLGYYPNLLARSLRSQKSYCIGIVFASSFEEINDPNTSNILSGIGSVVDKTSYNLYMFSGYEYIKERSLNAARGKMVDALIYFIYSRVYNYFHREIAPELKKAEIPFIGVHYYQQHIDTNCVCLQPGRACQLACEHLASTGRQELGFLDYFGGRSYAGQEMQEAFRTAVGKHDFSKHTYYQFNDFKHLVKPQRSDRLFLSGKTIARSLVEKKELLNAYFISSDVVAAGFIEGLKEKGVSVPADVAIVGYGRMLGPFRGEDFITTVDCGYARCGEQAAGKLLDMLENGTPPAMEKVLQVEPRLIVRQSCGTNGN